MKQFWNDEELGKYWSLTYQELELLKTKPQKHHLRSVDETENTAR